MLLSKIIEALNPDEIINFQETEIRGISYNSKTANSNDIFVCLKGETSDGHNFAKTAEDERGVKVFLVETKLEDVSGTQLVVKSTKKTIANLANIFYKEPSKALNVIGITGTNGKTTVTHLVQKIIEQNNEKCALIGTLGHKLSSQGAYLEVKHTTPQAVELQSTFKKIRESGIKNVAIEVSSHALEQNRVGGTHFKGAVFTNLTQDHLDYHITMTNYFEAKSILFKNLTEGSFAVINSDDDWADKFLVIIPKSVEKITYGIKNESDVMAKDITFTADGAEFTCVIKGDGEYNVKLQMNGMFSIYNTLAAFCVGLAMGIGSRTCIEALEHTKGVDGRFEIVHKKPLVIVDYAHTPDGLENVLKAALELKQINSKLICLFGCGGDRDTTKRPKMGEIADRFADKIIVTSDNPRSEDPALIISDILTGMRTVNPQKLFVEANRGKAIALIKKIATENDVVVVAGKGHEDYQILKDETIHFDDREEVKKLYS